MKNNLIIKHNNLIEAQYRLNLNEQKVILYAVSKLDRSKEKFNILSLNIREFFELLGTTQERYTEIREIVRELRKKEVTINVEKKELITGWLSSIEYFKNEGIIELEFSEKLVPYLLQLKEKFTKYELENILYLKNKHSIRIYELLKQYEKIGKRKISIDELRKYLSIQKDEYLRFSNFEKRVLQITKEEINKHTDLIIDYEKIKTGRQITDILFTIEFKESKEDELLQLYGDIEEMKRKMGLANETFSKSQVVSIYEKAVEKTAGNGGIDVYEYVRLNFLNIRDKAKNKYGYLLKAVENDFAKAAAQISLDYCM